MVLLLFLLFLQFFGIPAIQKYLRRDTMFVHSKRKVERSDYPVISIMKTTNYSDQLKTKCYYNQTDYNTAKICLEENVDDLEATVIDVLDDAYASETSIVKQEKWKTIFTIPYWGKVFSLQDSFNLSYKKYLKFVMSDPGDDVLYSVRLHDKRFYYDCTEQMTDFENLNHEFGDGRSEFIYVKIEHVSLLSGVSNCNDNESYSFRTCVKVLKHHDVI